MKNLTNLVLITAILISASFGSATAGPLSSTGQSPRENICLNGKWDLLVWPESKPDREFDTTLTWPPTSKGGWYATLLPQNLYHFAGEFSEKPGEQPVWRSVGYPSMTGWFKRQFTLPADWSGKRILFRSEGVCYDATIYVNGKYIGRHRNPFPFVFDITAAVSFGTANEIHLGYVTPQILQYEKDETVVEPDGDMLSRLAGPYGDMYLEAVGGAYIDDINILCGWDKREIKVDIDTVNSAGEKNLSIEALVHDGSKVVKSGTATFSSRKINTGSTFPGRR